ncbi:MAG TPA: M1 family metallopeptidase [Bacteroidales bacterium]|nr:M1 family metallopeptidase [Bacteroidales bacterium]
MRKSLFFIILCIFMMPLYGQIILKAPLSPRLTGYDINATLVPDKHIVSGTVKAYWINPSKADVSEAMLHMYMNAFKSNKTDMSTEGGMSVSAKDGYGWIRIKTINDNKGNNLLGQIHYVQPDDLNTDDHTVLKIDLPFPVKPGDTLWLNMTFETKLPSPIRRTGFKDDFYFVGQWFPKFGVYEPAGMRQRLTDGWNCHQFHSNSEFYSNHSVYNVSVTLPDNYVAGSGGKVMSEIKNDDGTKTITWRAEDIVDFAWTAWPGYKVFTDKWRDVDITFLTSEPRIEQVDRQLSSLKNALEYLDRNVGPFPWPHVTFVDPPTIGAGAGGMEYTTLFTSASGDQIPEDLHMPEMVTVHEFGHAYFMGILASNEFEESWLDEGVNTFWEQRIMDHYYGDGYGLISFPFLRCTDVGFGRLQYAPEKSRSAATNDLWSWNYPHNTYGFMSYSKTSLWLQTLQGLIGEETMNHVFREYYRRWAFRHPSGRDFIAVVNDVVKQDLGDKYGPDMNWFFDQVLYGSGICDYSVVGISNKKISGYRGVVIEGDSIRIEKPDRKADTITRSVAKLERPGDVIIPVDVLVHFDNGDEIREQWDGKARTKDYVYEGKREIQWVKIDPDNKIPLDVNLVNNSFTLKDNKKAVRRMTDKYVSLMQLMISIITL